MPPYMVCHRQKCAHTGPMTPYPSANVALLHTTGHTCNHALQTRIHYHAHTETHAYYHTLLPPYTSCPYIERHATVTILHTGHFSPMTGSVMPPYMVCHRQKCAHTGPMTPYPSANVALLHTTGHTCNHALQTRIHYHAHTETHAYYHTLLPPYTSCPYIERHATVTILHTGHFSPMTGSVMPPYMVCHRQKCVGLTRPTGTYAHRTFLPHVHNHAHTGHA